MTDTDNIYDTENVNNRVENHTEKNVTVSVNSEQLSDDPQKAIKPFLNRKLASEVSLLATGALALPLCAAFYAVIYYYFPGGLLQKLFLDHGWVPYFISFLTFWSCAMIFFKYRFLREQNYAFNHSLIKNMPTDNISPQNIDHVVKNTRLLLDDHPTSILTNRLYKALSLYKVNQRVGDVREFFNKQSEADASVTETSYTMLKVFIWAIPILGFIGTVLGIAASVEGFSASIQSANEIEVLQNSLGSVTSGLAFAFDTTLIALVMSIIIMFPTSYVQKSEERLLLHIEEFCNDHLLPRLEDTSNNQKDTASIIESAIAKEMAPHHAAIQDWHKRLSTVGGSIVHTIEENWLQLAARQQESLQDELRTFETELNERQEKLHTTTRETHDMWLDNVGTSVNALTKSINESQVTTQQLLTDQRNAFLETLEASRADSAESTTSIIKHFNEIISEYSQHQDDVVQSQVKQGDVLSQMLKEFSKTHKNQQETIRQEQNNYIDKWSQTLLSAVQEFSKNLDTMLSGANERAKIMSNDLSTSLQPLRDSIDSMVQTLAASTNNTESLSGSITGVIEAIQALQKSTKVLTEKQDNNIASVISYLKELLEAHQQQLTNFIDAANSSIDNINKTHQEHKSDIDKLLKEQDSLGRIIAAINQTYESGQVPVHTESQEDKNTSPFFVKRFFDSMINRNTHDDH